MKQSKFTESQIVAILLEGDSGSSHSRGIPEERDNRQHIISMQKVWRIGVSELSSMKEIEGSVRPPGSLQKMDRLLHQPSQWISVGFLDSSQSGFSPLK